MRISDWSSDVCSSDLDVAAGDPRVRVIEQGTNRGKGAALRRGFADATAEIVLVQDADLEYDPGEFGTVVGPIVAGAADVVFGSRLPSGGPHQIRVASCRVSVCLNGWSLVVPVSLKKK